MCNNRIRKTAIPNRPKKRINDGKITLIKYANSFILITNQFSKICLNYSRQRNKSFILNLNSKLINLGKDYDLKQTYLFENHFFNLYFK
jgi:hypothetical protein